jgi:putative ATP-binding cassette transporter
MLTTLSKHAPNRIFLGIVLGALSGIVYSLLIPILTSALQAPDGHLTLVPVAPYHWFGLEIANPPIALLFGAACAVIVLCRTASQAVLARVAMEAASNLRSELYGRIARAPVPVLERLGSARLISTINSDVPRIVMGAQAMPELLTSGVTLLGMLGFLLYLNEEVFVFVLECIAFGALTYELPLLAAKRFFVSAGDRADLLQRSVDGLIRGIKELKLDEAKRRAYFAEDLIANEHAMLAAQKSGNLIMNFANSYGDMICFFGIGAITFIFVNYHSVQPQEMLGVVMALLYITGPVAVILNMMPQLTMARVSYASAAALLAELPDEGLSEPGQGCDWDVLRVEALRYVHAGSEDTPGFAIGPIDAEFRKGEISFIVGGNGSGKSTLCKLLTLHYRAASGTIRFGTTVLDDSTMGTLRQDVAAIYSDYYLFDRILGKEVEPGLVEHYLRLFKLDAKVKYRGGRFSTLSLSDGQRRRMALVAAFVEDKELYLFDEWAADQDPGFKEAFYHEILPALKARGKAVIAITHDDRYFHLADQMLVMADGLVVERRIPAASAAKPLLLIQH